MRKLIPLYQEHVDQAKKDSANNPIALALRASGYRNINFDGTDLMSFSRAPREVPILTIAPKPARKWLRDWLSGKKTVVPFHFYFNDEPPKPKVFVVVQEWGEYDSSSASIVAVFRNQGKAATYVKEQKALARKQHRDVPHFDIDEVEFYE